MYLYVTTQRCPNKIFKTFLIENVFHLSPVSTTPVVHLELRISPRIFEKFESAIPYGDIEGLGGNRFMKKPDVENLVSLSL
jgi:hypothetical protein